MRRIIYYNLTLVLLFTIFISSCATILQGRKQTVRIYSNPQGARVFVNGIDSQKQTPCKIRIRREIAPTSYNNKNEVVYTLKKRGYNDLKYRDKSRFNWITLLDFSMGIFPGIIDVSNGSHRVYSPELSLVLNPKYEKHNEEIAEYNSNQKFVAQNDNYIYLHSSDVDVNIPITEKFYPYRYALIIGNEDYSKYHSSLNKEINVDFARNDASAFREYAQKTLGIPKQNIIFLLDATSGQMKDAIEKFSLLSKYSNGKAELVFYYAGHGLPDDKDKEPYLIPVDVSGKNLETAIKLKDLYLKLNKYPNKRTLVFLDACFSGGARNQGLIAARGIRVKPKENKLEGNIVVFSASSQAQTSLPLKDEKHGLFTYYLLKELQQTRGDVKLVALSAAIKEQVSIASVLINSKEQTPEVNLSADAIPQFATWILND